ncbi:30S ribosome-binding factor RbfA [Candidatus Mycoplasma pogonae]
MNSITHAKLEQRLLILLAKIISEDVQNVNITPTTVVDVKLTRDGSIATVYVSFLSHESRSLEYLIRSKGFIRSELSKYWDKRKTPNLIFKIDEVAKQTEKLEKIFQKIKEEEN